MRRHSIIIGWVLFVFLFAAVNPRYGDAETNFIKNPGFEEPFGTHFNISGEFASYYTTTEEAHSGSKSLKVSGLSNSRYKFHASQVIAEAKPNRTYIIEGYVKTNLVVVGEVKVYMDIYRPQLHRGMIGTVSGTTDWVKVSWNGYPTSSDLQSFAIGIEISNQGDLAEGTVYLDSFKMVEVSNPPTWNSTVGIGSVENVGGNGVKIEFGSATDDYDGSNVRYNLYYAPSSSWNDGNWSSNSVVADMTPVAGTNYDNAYTLNGLTDGVSYTFGIRVADPAGHEDGNTGKMTLLIADPDSDADGLPDEWEMANFGDLTQGPDDDPDGDLISNLQEYQQGTDPNVSDIPIDTSTKLLIHSDLQDGDSTFTDSGETGHAITRGGNARHVTSRAKIGGSSIYCDRSDHLSISNHNDFDFGADDFTIDFWVYPLTGNDHESLIGWTDSWPSEQSFFTISYIGNGQIYATSAHNNTPDFRIISTLPTQEWTHLALVRNGSDFLLFNNGVLAGSDTHTGAVWFDSSNTLRIGAQDHPGNSLTHYGFNGHLDEIRISKGVARWTGNFTPPSAPYSNRVNEAPEGIIDTPASDVTINAGESVSFSATATDIDGNTPFGFIWDFGDATIPNGLVEDPGAVQFDTPGSYTVSLRVTDASGAPDPTPATRVITVEQAPDTTPPAWDGATAGIGSANYNTADGSVTVAFGAATDDVDGTNVKYNLYYAPTGSWDNTSWSNNTSLLDITPIAGTTHAYVYNLTGLSAGTEYTLGIRVSDQAGNEDDNVNTATVAVPAPAGNDFTSDSSCVALWRFEPGALTADSKGTNTLTDNNTVRLDTVTHQEGEGCVDFNYGYAESLSIDDSDLDAEFPLKSGTANKKISVACWFKVEIDGDCVLFAKYHSTDNKRSLAVRYEENENRILGIFGYGSGENYDWVTIFSGLSINRWYHLGFTYDDATKTWAAVLHDQDTDVETTNTGVLNNHLETTTARWTIGRYDQNETACYWDGKIDEMAVFNRVLSTAEIRQIRTGTYQGPAAGDDYAVLLIHSDAADGATSFTDSSNSNHSITPYNDAKHATAAHKFGATAISLDGNGDYLKLADSPDWDFGSGDFTIDFWMYLPSITGCQLLGQSTGGDKLTTSFAIWLYSDGRIFGGCSDGTDWRGGVQTATSFLSPNLWYHVAYMRNGNTFSLYVNGQLVGTADWSGAVQNVPHDLIIGSLNGGSNYFNGYLDELRISKGIARWTTNFTPPAQPYGTPINPDSDSDGLPDEWEQTHFGNLTQGADGDPDGDGLTNLQEYQQGSDPNVSETAVDAYTKLLIHSDTTDGATSFTDSSDSNHAITPYNDAKHATAAHKFGATAISLDGNGDYLKLADSPDWDFGSGDFTIDFWMYLPSITGCQLLGQSTGGDKWTTSFAIWLYSDGRIRGVCADGADWRGGIQTATSSVAVNQWYHVAYLRSGSTFSLYVNGQLAGTADWSGGVQNVAHDLIIGGLNGGSNYFNGYLDELRISKGIARWTASFTPPSQPYGSPANPDSDGDGLPDEWEQTHFGDLSQGPDDDPDGDGLTNLQEYQQGVDPNTRPPTVTLSDYPVHIQPGDTGSITWSTTYATSCRVEVSAGPEIGEVALNGTINIAPTVVTVYTFIATGPGGEERQQIAVIVDLVPEVTELSVSPEVIALGDSAIISWCTKDADYCRIEPGVNGGVDTVAANGTLTVSPTELTHYTLTAVGPGGKAVSKALTLDVRAPRTLIVPSNDYPDIQSAITDAFKGDTVLVTDGTYSGAGNTNLDFEGKAITVRSVNGPSRCTIDCNGAGSGVHFCKGEGAGSVLQGFTIREAGSSGIVCYRASPTIIDCIITENKRN